MLRLLLPIAFLLICTGEVNAVRAGDLPVSSEVKVQATAANATDARAKALKQGEQEAFRRILEKYAPEKAESIITHMPREQISAMVTGFELVEEKISSNRYEATVIISFDGGQMRKLIGRPLKPITAASVEAGSSPAAAGAMMVLPILQRDGVTYLWEADNFWRSIWNSVALEKGSGKLVMPYGDPEDLLLLRSENAPRAPYERLARLAERYGAGEILLATASYRSDSPVTVLDVTLTRIDSKGRQVSRTTYMAQGDESYDSLLVRAANDISAKLVSEIDENMLAGGKAPPLVAVDAIAKIPRVKDWNLLRSRLEALPAVQAVEPLAISYGQVEMQIIYRGTPEILGESLLAADLSVSRVGNHLLLGLN